jgi:hypothetical protein
LFGGCLLCRGFFDGWLSHEIDNKYIQWVNYCILPLENRAGFSPVAVRALA